MTDLTVPPPSTTTNLRLSGAKLPFARAAFLVLSLAAVTFFAMGVSLEYASYIKSIDAETQLALQQLNLSTTFYAMYQTGLVILLAIGFGIAGLIIFWNKSNDWLGLLVAFTLIGQGVNAFGPLQRLGRIPEFTIPVHFVVSMVLMGLPLSCYLFPDGRIQKRWMPYIAGIWFIWLMISTFWVSFPVSLFKRGGNATLVYLLSLLAVLSTGIYAQVYRYRHAESTVRRKQLKWIVFGVAVGILTGIGVNLFLTFFQLTKPAAGTYLIVDMATQTLSVVAQLMVPLAVVFSIQKHRLYDIDLVINRSIVYGLLTLFLAAIFGVILWGLQTAFELITHQSNPPTVGIIAATIAITSLFQPTRKALRRFINRKVYRIDFDFDAVAQRKVQFAQAARSSPHAFSTLGGYQDAELIGRGGMGEIYKARHPNLNRTVAIKILSAFFKGDSGFHKRFTREAKAMAQLRHPNIITIHDFGEQDGIPYIVMEYLTGKSLSQILRERGRLSLEEALPLLQDLASALDYAHAQGIIHRDIKPSNVIVEPITTVTGGRTQRAILMDFGIARLTYERTRLTLSGDVVGTAGYISPEQIRGEMEIDHRADLYSVGIMVYEVLTGKKPFEHENTWALIRAHLEEPPPDPRDVISLPEEAAQAIMKAMAKKREKRFSTAGEFVAELGKEL